MLLLVLGGLIGSACSDEADDTSAFCAAVSAAPSLESLIRGFTSQDPDTLTRNLDAAQEVYARVRDTAPAEVRDETETLISVVDIVVDAVRDNPDDRLTAIEEVRRSLEEIGPIEEETTVVTDMIDRRCGIDVNAGLLQHPDDRPDPPSPSTIPN